MFQDSHWPEAANRRLRAFLWRGWSVGQMSVVLGRSALEIQAQMKRLGLVRSRRRRILEPLGFR